MQVLVLTSYEQIIFHLNRESQINHLYQPSDLFEDEVLEEPIGGVVPEINERVSWDVGQLLGDQVRDLL